jgi:hypothetical protein
LNLEVRASATSYTKATHSTGLGGKRMQTNAEKMPGIDAICGSPRGIMFLLYWHMNIRLF